MFFQLFLNVCAPIFLIVGLGRVLDRKFRLHLESLVKLNIYLFVPAFIFTHMLGTELAGSEALRIVAFTLATIVFMYVGSALAARVFKMEGRQRQSLSLATKFYNCGNYGLPLVTLAFGLVTLGVQMSQTRPAPFRAPLWSAIGLRLLVAPLPPPRSTPPCSPTNSAAIFRFPPPPSITARCSAC